MSVISTIGSSPAQERSQSLSICSLPKNILRVTCIALLILKGNSLWSCDFSRCQPVQFSFDPRADGTYHGSTWETGFKDLTGCGDAQNLCYLPIDHFATQHSEETDERCLLAQYYHGRRYACGFRDTDPKIMDGELYSRLWKERESDRLKGLAFMYNTGALEVIYPQKGKSFDAFVSNHISYKDVTSMYYGFDGCYYFTAGTLLCPDKSTFHKLESRFVKA